mmetsp:Transcript_22320/g.71855  ORF Transcript_22320/g.71855 Transcript_22320/m.71855 type:complete len:221 (-) Transcript_22320:16-678(-)
MAAHGASNLHVGQPIAGDEVARAPVLGDGDCANDTARRRIPRHGEGQGLGHKLLALLLGHARPIHGVAEAVDVGRSRATNGKWLLHQRAAQGDRVHRGALHRIPARDDDAGHQRILVVVDDRLEQVCRRLHRGRLVHVNAVLVQEMPHVVRDCLSIRGGPRAAAIDPIVHRSQLVGRPVRHIAPRGSARVGTDHHSAVEGDRHDGRAKVHRLAERVRKLH